MLLIYHLISHGPKKDLDSKHGKSVRWISTLGQLQGIKPREPKGGTEAIDGDRGGVRILAPDAHKSGIVCKWEYGEKTHGKPFEFGNATWCGTGTRVKCADFISGALCNRGKRGSWITPRWGWIRDRMKCDIIFSLKESLFAWGIFKAQLMVGGR